MQNQTGLFNHSPIMHYELKKKHHRNYTTMVLFHQQNNNLYQNQ